MKHQPIPHPATMEIDAQSSAARDRLLKKIHQEADLPALGHAVSQVVQHASSDDEAVGALAQLVLADVALAQKLLRMANTVFYRAAAGQPVTTISRAIFLLGFDTVKTLALAMLLVEGLPGTHRQSLHNELNQSFCASLVARELARRSRFKDAEEAAVAALFRNIGQILVATHDPALYEKIAQAVNDDTTVQQASSRLLGFSYTLLAQGVLHEWKIPASIVHSLTPLPAASAPLRPAERRQDWLQQVADFAEQAAQLVLGAARFSTTDLADAARERLFRRYGSAFSFTREEMSALLLLAAHESAIVLQHTLPKDGHQPKNQ